MEVKALIENLTDSGCSVEETRRAKALYEAGDMDGLSDQADTKRSG